MDTLQTIQEHVNGLPIEVWYASTLILMGVLIWLFKEAITWMKENLKEMRSNMETMGKILVSHETQLANHSNEIKDLKEANKNKRR